MRDDFSTHACWYILKEFLLIRHTQVISMIVLKESFDAILQFLWKMSSF